MILQFPISVPVEDFRAYMHATYYFRLWDTGDLWRVFKMDHSQWSVRAAFEELQARMFDGPRSRSFVLRYRPKGVELGSDRFTLIIREPSTETQTIGQAR